MSVAAMQNPLNNTAQLGASVGSVSSPNTTNGGGAGGAAMMAPSSSSNTAGGQPNKLQAVDSLSGLSASVAAMSMNPAGSSSSSQSGRRDPNAKGVASGATVAATSSSSTAAAANSASASGRVSAQAKRPEDPKSSSAGAKDDALTQALSKAAAAQQQQRPKANVSQIGSTAPPQSQIGAPSQVSGVSANGGAAGGSSLANANSAANTPHNSVIQQTSGIVPNQNKAKKDKQSISYAAERVIGNGSFGVVYQATVIETGETVAIKKVLQDRRFKNRELQIMGMLDHPDVVALKHCFYSKGEKPDDVFLNLVMEYIPETIHRTLRNHTKAKKLVPIMYTKVYMYQVSRALAYIHSCGICHRDIKPQNLLLNTKSHDVKLCDFGSAKILIRGEPNVAYICSRYYRAPELVFEATEYTCAIDIWSLGCVMAELLLGKPLFPGDSGVDQLIEIIKILGTPTKEQIQAMNPNHQSFKFPQIKPHPWAKVFRNKAPPDAIDLVSKLLHYEPHLRLDPFEALSHPFFDELREPNARLPNGKPLPNLFNWTEVEYKRMEVVGLTKKLCPPHLIKSVRDKFKATVLPTAPPVNPYASPYPHIIAQMAALAQQQAAMGGATAAATGSAAGGATGMTASSLGPMVIPPFQGQPAATAAAAATAAPAANAAAPIGGSQLNYNSTVSAPNPNNKSSA